MAATFSPNLRPLSSFDRSHNFGKGPDPELPRSAGGETWEDFFAAEMDGDREEVLSSGAAAEMSGSANLDRVESGASAASSGSFWARRLQRRTPSLIFPSRRPSLPALSLPSRPFTSGGGATPRRLAKRPKTAPGPRTSTFASANPFPTFAAPAPALPDMLHSPSPSSPASSTDSSVPPPLTLAQRVLFVLSLGMAGRPRKRARTTNASGRSLRQTANDGRGWASVTGF